MFRMRFGTCAIFVGVTLAAIAAWFGARTSDPLGGMLAAVLSHDTVYSEGYSDACWNRVRVGMSKAEVRKLIGPPLLTYTTDAGEEAWQYTKQNDTTANWHMRILTWQRGLVFTKRTEFLVD